MKSNDVFRIAIGVSIGIWLTKSYESESIIVRIIAGIVLAFMIFVVNKEDIK